MLLITHRIGRLLTDLVSLRQRCLTRIVNNNKSRRNAFYNTEMMIIVILNNMYYTIIVNIMLKIYGHVRSYPFQMAVRTLLAE